MSTATTTLPAPVSVTPTVVTQPAAKTTVTTPTPEPKKVETKAAPPDPKAADQKIFKEGSREVPHDWKAESAGDVLAERLGRIKRLPAPEATPSEEKTGVEPEKVEATETHADDDEEPVSKEVLGLMDKKARDAFNHRNFKMREYKRERNEARLKLEELQKQVADSAALKTRLTELESQSGKVPADIEAKLKDYEAREKLYQEQEARVAALDVRQSDKYQREIGKPLSEIEAGVREIAALVDPEGTEGWAEAVLAAYQLPTAKRIEALDGLTAEVKPAIASEIMGSAKQYAGLKAAEREMLTNAKQTWDSMQQEANSHQEQQTAAQKRQQQEAREAYQKAVPERWKALSEAAGIAAVEGAESYNSDLNAASRWASDVEYQQFPTEARVDIMHRAALHPFLLGKLQALEKQLASERAELAKYRGADIGAGSGSRVTPTPEPENTDDDDPGKNVAKKLASAGVFSRKR